MKTSEMRGEGKFLRQEDVGKGVLLTVKGVKQFNVAMAGAEPSHKWCLLFQEEEKPLVLNMINTQLCESIFGSDDTDDWTGHKVVLYTDPTVTYGGKLVGGIRVRQPKKGAVKEPPKPLPVEEEDDDEIPF